MKEDTMLIERKEIKQSKLCWCGLKANYHHIASTKRRDKKRTVWYQCPNGHKIYDSIDDR